MQLYGQKTEKIRQCSLLSDKLGITMKKIAIYPGSFDPITNGHVDLIKRASKIFDEVIIAITQNANKSSFLTIEQRVGAVESSIKSLNNTRVLSFNSLLVDFARDHDAQIIIRGLRAVSDFEYEFQLSGMNKRLNSEIETLFMTPSEEFANISSSLVREILSLGGDISPFVPAQVKTILLDTLQK
jgi:pantetheine-phosphate adenylyltransferase